MTTIILSIRWIGMMVIGIALWLHSIPINDLPPILANAVTLVLAGIILLAKIRLR